MNSALRYNNWDFFLGEVERNIICWLICGLYRSKYMGSARHLQAGRLKVRHYKRSHQTQVSMFVTTEIWQKGLLEPRSLFPFLGFLTTIFAPVIFMLIFLFYKSDYVDGVFLYGVYYDAEDHKTWSHEMTGKERIGLFLLRCLYFNPGNIPEFPRMGWGTWQGI
jgi:hypothetical protein